MFRKKLSSIISALEESSEENFDKGISLIKEGLKTIFNSSGKVTFQNVADVLNFMLSEVPKGHCELSELTETDDYETILDWVRIHRTGDRFYMVHACFNNGETAIGVFFADENNVFINKKDPKICYTCAELPMGIKDLFGQNNIYVQHFN